MMMMMKAVSFHFSRCLAPLNDLYWLHAVKSVYSSMHVATHESIL